MSIYKCLKEGSSANKGGRCEEGEGSCWTEAPVRAGTKAQVEELIC